jgi:HEAT repeat protein
LHHAEIEMEVYVRRMSDLQRRLAQQNAGMQTFYFWASADEFIEALTHAQDEEKFLQTAPSIARAEDVVLDDAVGKLVKLLQDPSEQTRRRSAIVLRFLQELAPHRTEAHSEKIVAGLVPLLDDSSSAVVGETVFALRCLGPSASPACDALARKMADDDDPLAAQAALALANIEPSADIAPRLMELIEKKHCDWYAAAFALPQHTSPEQARVFLTRLYERANEESEQSALIQALNQIQTE